MINNVTMQGRFTKDPEIKTTQSGVTYANFTLAWSDKYKDVEKKCFLPCRAWRGTAEFIGKYFAKGKEAVVEGQLTQQEWTDNEGNKKSMLQLDVERVHFCGGKGDGQQTSVAPNASAAPQLVPVDDEPLPF